MIETREELSAIIRATNGDAKLWRAMRAADRRDADIMYNATAGNARDHYYSRVLTEAADGARLAVQS